MVNSISLNFFNENLFLDILAFLIHTICTILTKINLKGMSISTSCLYFTVFAGVKAGGLGKRENGRVQDTKIKRMWFLVKGTNSSVEELEACAADYNTGQAVGSNHRGINKVLWMH